MTVQIEKAVGFKTDPLPVAWNQRDLLLYAVSIMISVAVLALTIHCV